MSKKNIECEIKYCPSCHVRLQQGNCREEQDHVVLTRKCRECGYNVRVVEIDLATYNKTVNAMNKIIDLIAEVR
jgi:hypothetical protein